ncbi:MAG TPA: hypothetical protein VFI72_06670 [Candidatus Angelobacter sp.]|jgi:hypothetical protein|nr:hypothetical protein [Candidatus Angelobacter sp.]
MNDSQKWLQAAAGIEQDLDYLRPALAQSDIQNLEIALAVYRKNAYSGVPWPNPDDLYCIQKLPYQQVHTEMRRSHKIACC